MRAGSLKDRIEIQEKGTGTDAVGQPLDEYTKFADAYAEVTNIGASEKYFAGRYEEVDTKKFRIRFIDGVTTAMRIKLDDEFYDIKEVVDPYRNRRELLIAAKKV